MTDNTTYRLKFVFPDKGQRRRQFTGPPSTDMTLAEVRKKIDPADAEEPFYSEEWLFKNDSETKPAIERSEEKHNYVVDLIPLDEPPPADDADAVPSIVNGEIHLYVAPAPKESPDDLPSAQVAVKVGEDPAHVLSFDSSGRKITLAMVRTKLNADTSVDLPKDAVFMSSSDKQVPRRNEDRELVPNLDPDPLVHNKRATYTIKVWSKEKPPSGWKDAGDSPPPELPAPIELPTPVEIPANKFPTLPEPVPLTSTEDLVQWSSLGADERYAIARASGLFYGFNLPDAGIADAGDNSNFSAGAGALTTLDRSSQMLTHVGPKNVTGVGLNTIRSDESASYSRLETDVRRSLSTASSLKVAYAGYGAAEAEFKSAQARRRNSVQQNFFLSATIIVPRAEVHLPPLSDVRRGGLAINWQIHEDLDAASTTSDIYRLMAHWGALAAWKVVVGGALYVVESKTITDEFQAEKQKLEWSMSVKGGQGPLSVSASNKGVLDQEATRQANEQFKHADMRAYGGKVAYAVGKEIPQWVDSVSPPNAWATIGVEDLRPIYLLLDEARQDKFTNLLFRGGQAAWEKNTTLPSLRFIPFDWYMKPALSQAYDDFD